MPLSNNTKSKLNKLQGIVFFATNSEFLIPLYLQPNIVDLSYFNLSIMLAKKFNLKFQRFLRSGCKDIAIGRFEFVAKTQFLF